MSTILPPSRAKSWVYQVTALSVVLGGLLALSLKTQTVINNNKLPSNRWPVISSEFNRLKQDNANLRSNLAETNKKYEALARSRSRAASSKALEDTLDQAKELAGTVGVKGPGVIVTLQDSPKQDPAMVDKQDNEYYIIHDYDIRGIVNELFAAGAEAISVNGQRMVANSSIRCAGPVILVNTVQVAPPYRINAIGKPDVLDQALRMRGGVADNGLFLLDMIKIEKSNSLLIPKYTGSPRFNIARPVKD